MNKEKESLCSSCQHEKMCKFKKDFITAEKEFYKDEAEANKKFEEAELIKIKIDCKFYLAFVNIFTKKDINTAPSPFNPLTTTIEDNYCEKNCEWYKSMLTRTTPYIGDSPCEWCTHNKWKATWTTGTVLTSTSSASNNTNCEIKKLNK